MEEKSDVQKEEEEKVENKIEKDIKKEDTPAKENLTDKMRENPWIISTLALGILALILIAGNFSGGVTGNVVSEADAGEALLSFANTQGAEAELSGIEDIGDFYEVTLIVEGENIPLMVTKDGEYFLSGGLVPLNAVQQTDSQSTQPSQPADVPKSDKPVAELFIMSHCPYGTQAEKGIIPAIKALGNTADVKIRFVHYFMHEPEEIETPRQVCIREEQSDKFLDYLGCFLEDGDSNRCLIEAKIDKAKMNTCISSGKSNEYYAEDSALSEKYGVRGSPSLVINGVMANSGRSPSDYLETICSAFNEVPEECNVELSSASPSPMWGYEEGQDTGAQC